MDKIEDMLHACPNEGLEWTCSDTDRTCPHMFEGPIVVVDSLGGQKVIAQFEIVPRPCVNLSNKKTTC